MAPFAPATRLEGSGKPTVWSEFGALAKETKAVNLGQGFPDWQPPQFVVDEAHRALEEGFHQYTRPAGHPPLAEVIARRYSKHLERKIDAMDEVAITIGASQALYMTLQALVDPGDEVQAACRIHRLGQTRRVLLKKFIMKGTVEEAIEEFHSKLKTGVFKFSSGSMPKAAALLLCSK